jgi:hypothetical protein
LDSPNLVLVAFAPVFVSKLTNYTDKHAKKKKRKSGNEKLSRYFIQISAVKRM